VPAALDALAKESLLGFDTETRPAFRKGESYLPSLLQLGGENHVWMFQVQQIGNLVPLFEVLSDPKVIKTGVALGRDVQELRDLHEFKPAGFVELADLAEGLGFRNTGLRPLAALVLGGRISKGAQVSNWATKRLSKRQELYAATDAWVSRELYLKLIELQNRTK